MNRYRWFKEYIEKDTESTISFGVVCDILNRVKKEIREDATQECEPSPEESRGVWIETEPFRHPDSDDDVVSVRKGIVAGTESRYIECRILPDGRLEPVIQQKYDELVEAIKPMLRAERFGIWVGKGPVPYQGKETAVELDIHMMHLRALRDVIKNKS